MSSSWVIFDADNTLWDIEKFYDEARVELCAYLSGKGCHRDEVEEFQRRRDVHLHKTYGYSACRFPRSFEDTVINFLGVNGAESDIVHCRALALEVFSRTPSPSDGLEEVLQYIKSRYNVGLITAGERWVQERRLREFHLIDEIDAVEIVDEKTESVFLEFIQKYDLDPSQSWMVGDSFRSDIKPALEVGLNVFWYRVHNWNEFENPEVTPNGRVEEIADLRELLTKL